MAPGVDPFVVARLVRAIRVSSSGSFKDVDARDKPGHDEVEVSGRT
jgi:hypothetical protein